MPVTDQQLEMLEAYLDGELPAEQEAACRRQIEAETELSAALDALRAEHDSRVVVWSSYEPSDAAVARLIERVEAAVDRHNVWAYRLARWRIPSAAAACILVGFLV